MFIVKPLIDQAEPIDQRKLKVFRTAKGANEYAQTGAYAETGVHICEVHWVGDDLDDEQAVATVGAGKSEKRATIHRRLSASEIEEHERQEAIAFLRDLDLKDRWGRPV
jgi:hypothetical protein